MKSMIFLFVSLMALLPSACRAEVKEPAVAGAFYSSNPGELATSVDSWLASVNPSSAEGRLLALVVPHAGHIYSGRIAAHSYARIRGKDIRTVILIGPSHQAPLMGAAVYAGDGMRTPLGTVRVDKKLAVSLTSPKDHVVADAAPFAREHSLEVQLPFLQRSLQEFSVVPILIGHPTAESKKHLADALAALLKRDEKALIVISTDLSHYHDSSTAAGKDRKATDAMERLALDDLERMLGSGVCEMCGGWPVIYGLSAARGAGAAEGRLFEYADSGSVSGDRKRVVGYAAMGFYRNRLSKSAGAELLALAKEAVANHVNGKPLPEWKGNDGIIKAQGAAFVTLKTKSGMLRGCIGNIQPVMPLHLSVIRNAVAASAYDRRFPPVHAQELPGLDVEVTVLSPLEPVSDISEIIVGTHGVTLEAGNAGSVFLPQVPVEQGWDLRTYLSQLALKAGLPPDGWKGARLRRFTAEVIH